MPESAAVDPATPWSQVQRHNHYTPRTEPYPDCFQNSRDRPRTNVPNSIISHCASPPNIHVQPLYHCSTYRVCPPTSPDARSAMPHRRSGTVFPLKSLPATQKQLLRNTWRHIFIRIDLNCLIGSLSSASVARVWRYRNLIITIIMDARSAMRPCYILPMFFSYFFMPALVGQTAERIFTKLSHVVDIRCCLRTY